MADLAITASAVLPGSSTNVDRSGTAGTTITAGQLVYKDPTSSELVLSDSNGTGTRQVLGLALNGASAGQPLAIAKGGDVTVNAVLTAGVPYFLSGTAGAICPEADIVTGMQKIQVGIAKSTTVLHVAVQDTGVTL